MANTIFEQTGGTYTQAGKVLSRIRNEFPFFVFSALHDSGINQVWVGTDKDGLYLFDIKILVGRSCFV